MSTRLQKRSDIYSSENLDAILSNCAHWRAYKNRPRSDFEDARNFNRPAEDVRHTYEQRARFLALTVLADAKAEGLVEWSRSDIARFWCEVAKVDWVAYQ